MPIYEYRCRRCREVFDLAEHVAEHGKSHPRCPKCNSEEVEPVFTTFYAKTSKKS
ncbi:MAG: FmdB family transcriptional regulator [Betaproteobacteria bacterium RIFCSPLOWO2_12_FULL_62_13]|nr:MAG: FmdB family transcriptional regulator [Betaproteobacteria bacterium RIFCSPLOWO2_12_FULL_62_13]